MRRQELVQAGVTAREAEVLAAVAERLRNGEIAEQLVISVRTVESHIAALLSKLGAPDRSALIRLGRQLCRDVAPPPLPQPVAAFLGREKELAAVAERIHAGHLVTLVGPGGVGKTRLALRAADACGGAYMADMATVDSGTSVAAAVARALRAHEQQGRSL
jgi:DNA-binding CsgD family transcriptional regulator